MVHYENRKFAKTIVKSGNRKKMHLFASTVDFARVRVIS